MIKKASRNGLRLKRHRRVRAKVSGTTAMPRLSVYRSNKFIYAQIIDDSTGTTLVSAASSEKALGLASTSNTEAAKTVGQEIAKRAVSKGLESVVFDRSGYLYHGRIKALADAAREAGLKF